MFPQGEAPVRPPEPGEKPLSAAVGNQRQAEANLQQAKGKAAQQDEEAAVANLEKALAELKQEERRIASLPNLSSATFSWAAIRSSGDSSSIANRIASAARAKRPYPMGCRVFRCLMGVNSTSLAVGDNSASLL